MKNIPLLFLCIALVISLGFGLSSCKDDDPPVRPKLSFAESSMTVSEGDGTIQVDMVLDKAHSKDLRIEYQLGGTASDQDAVGTADADYQVVDTHGVVEIPAGATTGTIELAIFSDTAFEPDETIEISIFDTNTDEIELTAEDKVVITITNDDAQITASFSTTSMTVNEDDGVEVNTDGDLVWRLLQIPVQLDKPAPTDITVEFTIDIDLQSTSKNHAIDSAWGAQNEVPSQYFDYAVKGEQGKIVIPSGSTSANIEIRLRFDFVFEDDETIEITLTPSNSVQVGTNKTMIITVEQQDGKVIALVWDEVHTDVDMDMFLWVGNNNDTTTFDTQPVAVSLTPGAMEQAEVIFIPGLFTDGAFGLSYVYYSGTADPMNFEAQFVDFVDGVAESQPNYDIFSGTYTLANINPWDDEANGVYPPAIAQKFVITDGVYSYGKIQVPSTSSRLKKTNIPNNLRRLKGFQQKRLF